MIWVEVLNRRHEVVSRHRHSGASLHVGRGYDSDVVIDDPYVAPCHLRIFRDDQGRLIAEDCGSANGIFVTGSGKRTDRVPIDGDRVLRVGQTLLRIREPSYAVPPERILVSTRRGWHAAALLFAVLLAALGLLQWLRETEEVGPATLFMRGLAVVGSVLAWVAIWSLLSRLLSGHARFERHLSIAVASLLATVLIMASLEFGAYSLSARIFAEGAYAVGWLCIAAACYLHLRALGPTHRALKAWVPLGLAMLAIAGQTVGERESRSRVGDKPYVRNFAPPNLRLARPQELGEFMADAERMKATLDRERREKPAASERFATFDVE